MQKNLDQSSIFDPKPCQKLTYVLSDFLAKIYQWLENEKDFQDKEAVYFSRLCELLKLPSPKFLSLKTSRDCSQVKKEGILKRSCEQLPTLGYMNVNGSCLILDGFYPKIESGSTLSDILEGKVDQKYFLSEKAISMLKAKEKDLKTGYGLTQSIATISKDQTEKEQ